MPKNLKLTWIKEPFCGVSHAIGAVLAVAGLCLLLWLGRGKALHLTSFSIYGASLIVLYIASTLYHTLRVGERAGYWLQRLDHSAIFLLIAGSYTPVCLLALRGAWGWSLFGIIWGLAAFGVSASLFWRSKPQWLRVTLCVVMGWLVLVAIGPLHAALPAAALWWLLAGGITYSVGTVIYAADKPHLWPGKFSAHDLWHVFVIGGSVCHFVVMARYIAPLS
jgi:hemolysin III